MELLKRVLERRSCELADHLVRREGFDPELAERFVRVAGRDLRKSWEWHASVLDLGNLSSWANAQRLLGGIHTHSVAQDLAMEPPEVWHALRTFVPKVLVLMTRPESRPSHRPTSERSTPVRRSQRPGLLRRVSAV